MIMIEELVFTSAKRGLQIGKSGFCTVASTHGMAANLARLLESLSGYRHLHPPGSAEAKNNPIIYSHLKATVGGRPVHVLSRICDAGFDYSNRSNKLAHHLAVREPKSQAIGPAAALVAPGHFHCSWDQDPAKIDPRPLSGQSGKPQPCATWQSVSGDAGWAGDLIEAVQKRRQAYLIVNESTPSIQLIQEALALLPVHKQWGVTFSTFFTKLPPKIECSIRCVMAGSPEVAIAKRSQANFVLDLTQSCGRTASSLADSARQGKLIGDSGKPLVPAPSLGKPELTAAPDSKPAKVEKAKPKHSVRHDAEDDLEEYDLVEVPPELKGGKPTLNRTPPSVTKNTGGSTKWFAITGAILLLAGLSSLLFLPAVRESISNLSAKTKAQEEVPPRDEKTKENKASEPKQPKKEAPEKEQDREEIEGIHNQRNRLIEDRKNLVDEEQRLREAHADAVNLFESTDDEFVRDDTLRFIESRKLQDWATVEQSTVMEVERVLKFDAKKSALETANESFNSGLEGMNSNISDFNDRLKEFVDASKTKIDDENLKEFRLAEPKFNLDEVVKNECEELATEVAELIKHVEKNQLKLEDLDFPLISNWIGKTGGLEQANHVFSVSKKGPFYLHQFGLELSSPPGDRGNKLNIERSNDRQSWKVSFGQPDLLDEVGVLRFKGPNLIFEKSDGYAHWRDSLSELSASLTVTCFNGSKIQFLGEFPKVNRKINPDKPTSQPARNRIFFNDGSSHDWILKEGFSVQYLGKDCKVEQDLDAPVPCLTIDVSLSSKHSVNKDEQPLSRGAEKLLPARKLRLSFEDLGEINRVLCFEWSTESSVLKFRDDTKIVFEFPNDPAGGESISETVYSTLSSKLGRKAEGFKNEKISKEQQRENTDKKKDKGAYNTLTEEINDLGHKASRCNNLAKEFESSVNCILPNKLESPLVFQSTGSQRLFVFLGFQKKWRQEDVEAWENNQLAPPKNK